MAKKKLNILFTCAGRRVVLIQAFRKAMDQLGIAGKLFATDVTDSAPALKAADESILVPKVRNIKYIPSLLDIVAKKKIGLVIPLTDLDLRSLSRRQGKFADLGCTVMIGSQEAIKICRDKKLFNHHLSSGALPTIRTLSLAQFKKRPFYPCFAKPLHGSAGIGSALINNSRELKSHVHAFGEQLLVQNNIPGQEYTIDVFRRRTGQIECIVPRQRLIVRSGEVDVGLTVCDEELIESARKLVGLMDGLWGVFCCQCRRPKGGLPYFFEINPRFGGGAPLSIAAGANLPLYLIQEVLGLEITSDSGKFTPNMLQMRYSGDLYQQIDDPSTLPGFEGPVFK